MKKLTITQLEIVTAGDAVDGFCASFGAVALGYQIGVWANLWNPVGQSALLAGAVIGGACAVYALR